jgi:tetratricopeptide (TPR) repeat protein
VPARLNVRPTDSIRPTHPTTATAFSPLTEPTSMAKRKKNKLNANLLLGIVTGAVILGAGGFAGMQYMRAARSADLKEKGIKFLEEKNYEEASKFLSQYTTKRDGKIDLEGFMKQFQALNHLTSKDKKVFLTFLATARNASSVDPKNLEAQVQYLKLLMDIDEGRTDLLVADISESAVRDVYGEVREVARRVRDLDPKNVLGAEGFALGRAVAIRQKGTGLSSREANEWYQEMVKLNEEFPGSGRLWGRRVDASDFLLQSLSREQVPLRSDTGNAQLLVLIQDFQTNWPQVVERAKSSTDLATEDRSRMLLSGARVQALQAQFADQTVDTRKKLAAVVQELFDASTAVLKPGDPSYERAQFRAAQALQRSDFAKAEQLLRGLVDASPNRWSPRLELAELLRNNGQFKEALAVLDVKIEPSFELTGLEGRVNSLLEPEAALRRAMLCFLMYPTTPQADRAALIKRGNDERTTALVTMEPSNPRVLLVDAMQKEVVENDLAAASALLRRSLNGIVEGDPRMANTLDEVRRRSIDIAMRMGEVGNARRLLDEIIQRTPNAYGARLQRARLSLQEKNFDEANRELDVILSDVPDYQEAVQLKIAATQDVGRRQQLLEALPEDSWNNRQAKVRLAATLAAGEIVDRLALPVLNEKPADPALCMIIANYYTGAQNKEKALEVLEIGLKASPNSPELTTAVKAVKAETDEQRKEIITGYIDDKQTDYSRAMMAANEARRAGKLDDVIAKLQLAHEESKKLEKPRGEAAEQLWQIYLQRGTPEDLAAAEEMMKFMGSINFDQAQGRIYRTRFLLATSRDAKGNVDQAKLKEAETLARQIVRDLPDFGKGQVNLAMVQQTQGNFASALELFRSALDRVPNDDEALRGLIGMIQQTGGTKEDLQQAIANARARMPQSREFELMQLSFEETYGDPQKTLTRRQQLAKENPSSPEFAMAEANAYFAVGRKLAMSGAKEQAVQEWIDRASAAHQAAFDRFPTTLQFLEQYVRLKVMGGSKVEDVVPVIDKAEANPAITDKTTVKLIKVDAYLMAGQRPQAIAMLEALPEASTDRRVIARLSDLYMSAGDVDKALALFAGDSVEFTAARLQLLTQANRLTDALKVCDELIAKNPAPALLARRGELVAALAAAEATPEAREAKLTEARAIADKLIADSPNMIDARLLRARIEIVSKQPNSTAIVDDLLVVRRNQPTNVDARLLLANQYARLGRAQDYESEVISTYTDNNTNRKAVLAALGVYLAPPQRFTDAEAVIKAARENPLLRSDVEILSAESQMWSVRGDNDKALAASTAAMEAAPNYAPVQQLYIGTLVRSKKYAEAETAIAKVLGASPGEIWPRMMRGAALAAQQKKDQAVAEFKDVIASAGTNDDVVQQAVMACADTVGIPQALDLIRDRLEYGYRWRLIGANFAIRTGDRALAERLINLNLNQENMLPPAQRVEIHQQASGFFLETEPKQLDKSRASFEKLLELRGEDKMLLNNLAYVLTLQGGSENLAKAVEHAKKAYDLAEKSNFIDATDAYIMDTYGWTLILSGDADGKTDRINQGMDVLNRAAAVGGIPETFYHLGEGFIRLKQKESALNNLKNALDMVEKNRQDGKRFDAELPARIQDALRRAQELAQ